MDEKTKEEIIKLNKQGLSIREIADKLNINRGSVEYLLNKLKDNVIKDKDVVIEKEVVIEPVVIKDNTIIEEIMTEIPIYTEKEEVPKGCLEWKRKFTTDTYYPPGTVKHYIAWGTAGIEKEEGLRLLKLWNKEHKDVLPEMKTKTVKIENKPLPNYPDKDIHETHDLIKRGSDWIWIEK